MTEQGDLRRGEYSANRDGRAWRIGRESEVEWIVRDTPPGLEITAAIPARFEAYATVVIPQRSAPDESFGQAQDAALIDLLAEYSSGQSWWLGYLETSDYSDVVFPEAPKVELYTGWNYTLVEAGPEQAQSWRSASDGWTSPLPDLMFPADRSWLVSKLWDDDWRCLGGTASLVARVLDDLGGDARQVQLGQDATPSGHTAH